MTTLVPPDDENLPEVVPDSSPQALSGRDAFLAQDLLSEPYPKYVAESSPRPEERDLKFPAGDGDENKVKDADRTLQSPTSAAVVSPIVSPSVGDTQGEAEEAGANEGDPPSKKDEIFGIKRKTFWFLLVVVVIVVLAAIGGGVGGGIAASRSRADAQAADEASPSTTITKTTPSTTTSSPTGTSTPEPNFLNNGTIPDRGIAFQAFSGTNYMGEASGIYNEEGFFDLGFNATSYVWIPNTSDCCVTFCQSEKNTSQFWCKERYRAESSGSFPRLGILCGTDIDRDADEHRCV
ncbi:uncharacterized protein DNG_09102 [Cephalotrichum gorgonifer]|uniref:Uncharacterized protein n=1 Tax=Cephalotrichum gorgonifer TaxID=2041049 RepID=A0AAE8N765_9PEZI|nr:uncharacterized protein DNG_09102 [Cephalotrichum gorgonifer]